jgi:hypothetical protein
MAFGEGAAASAITMMASGEKRWGLAIVPWAVEDPEIVALGFWALDDFEPRSQFFSCI